MTRLEVGRAWRYSRYDDRNTACSALSGRITSPRTLWSFKSPDGRACLALAADTNGDGKNEVVVAGKDNLFVLAGPDGRLLWEKQLTCHGRYAEVSPAGAVFDIDHDGDPEIMVAAGNAGATVVSARDGRMVWQHPTFGAPGLGFARMSSIGWTDILQTDLWESRRIYRLRGFDGLRVWEAAVPGTSHDLPVACDINGDGVTEVVFRCSGEGGSAQEHCMCLSESGKLIWQKALGEAPEARAQSALAPTVVADFLGDGRLQILCLTRSQMTLIDGSGAILWQVAVDGPAAGAAVGDADGDGRLEIALGSKGVTCYRGASGEPIWSLGTESGSEACAPIMADVDGDGSLEVVAVSSEGRLQSISGKTGELLWEHDVQVLGCARVIWADIDSDMLGELVVCSGDLVTAVGA